MNLDGIMVGGVPLTQILLVLLFAVCGVIAVNLPYWKPKGKKITCNAAIISKRVEYSNTPQIYYGGNRWNYLVTFECEDGSTVELHVFEAQYSELKEGIIGELTYKGDSLLSFN